jgi:hypothetical protein
VRANDNRSGLRNVGTVLGAPDANLRFMRRRRSGTADRNGDPLDGIVNLWNVAIVLAVGFLVAALTAVGAGGLLTDHNMTVVTNPGAPDMQVIVKSGDKITKLDMAAGAQAQGVGTLIGSFYRLADGTVIYVPEGQTAPDGSTPITGTTPLPTTPGPIVPGASTPAPETTSLPGTLPTPGITPTIGTPPAPEVTPTVTLTPEAGRP